MQVVILFEIFGARAEMSHEKKPPTFYYTGWLIGIRDPYNGLL